VVAQDVASLVQGIIVADANECQKYCQATATCNSYVYCNRAQGCGEYCPDYINTLPKRECEGSGCEPRPATFA
jgi:hypothetical protein